MSTVIEQANQLLQYLSSNINHDYQAGLASCLDAAELEINKRNIATAMNKLGIDTPAGIYMGSTSALKEAASVQSQEAIKVLKSAGRIIQAGKGRGKAIVVASTAALDELSTPSHSDDKESEETISANDFIGMASHLQRALYHMQKDLEELRAKVLKYSLRISELETTLEEQKILLKEAQTEVEQQTNLNKLTTWS